MQISQSGNLADARRLNHRRPALPFGKTRRLVLIGIHTPELLTICVIDGDEPMVMFPPPILVERTLLFARGFLCSYFCHCDFSCTGRPLTPLSQVNRTRASTVADGHVNSIIYATRGHQNFTTRKSDFIQPEAMNAERRSNGPNCREIRTSPKVILSNRTVVTLQLYTQAASRQTKPAPRANTAPAILPAPGLCADLVDIRPDTG